MTIVNDLRPEALNAPFSGIDEVISYGRGKPGLIPFWAGEGHLVTPSFIRDAAVQGLADGETFYTWQNGIPDLREALARYHQRHFGRQFTSDEFIVTIGGMHAITLAMQATVGSGDELLYLTPAWPNIVAAASVAGVVPVPVPLRDTGTGWVCDMDSIEAAVTPRTKAIFLNTPSNPTGWMASHEDLRQILDLARRRGLWIIADEIYSVFSFEGGRAPSFYDVMDAEDRIIFVNTFSKNWSMTGWRIGWLSAHPSLTPTFAKLVQCSTSGVPQFLQRGGIAALDQGDTFLAEQIAQAKGARDAICRILGDVDRIRFSVPQGAFYLFFAIEGLKNSRDAAFELIDKTGVGLAPGSAFGKAGDGYLRMCFLRDRLQVEDAATRVAQWARG
jgi:aspartate/methionine/tyrosine aminotransferase